MSNAWIWTAVASVGDAGGLAALLARLGGAPLAAWLEDEGRPEGLVLRADVAPADAGDLVADWPRGRLFSPAGDLQWARIGDDRRHYVLIGGGVPLPGGEHEALRALGQPAPIALWGERRDGRWHEGRIPQVERFYKATTVWPGPFAAIETQRYGIPWPAHGTERIVTRYIRFITDHEWMRDQRFR